MKQDSTGPRAGGDDASAVEGAGTDRAAFPVGALAGAAVGGVGGALVGEETEARHEHDERPREDDSTGDR